MFDTDEDDSHSIINQCYVNVVKLALIHLAIYAYTQFAIVKLRPFDPAFYQNYAQYRGL